MPDDLPYPYAAYSRRTTKPSRNIALAIAHMTLHMTFLFDVYSKLGVIQGYLLSRHP